ncbi:MAG: hypothetical protein M5U01_08390 [Ardenticatenaceae bacterium]|nr:hypothetical protein [Ardenticatenaceae bacterium]
MAQNDHSTLRLGCTYWPRRRGPWFWNEHFDRGEIRGELDHLADLGCELVRVLLPWALFQPQPALIARTAFDQFGQLLDTGEAARVSLVPVLFVGALGGIRFLPRWLLRVAASRGQALAEREPRPRTISEGWLYAGAIQNFYEQRDLVNAQRFLIRELVGYFGPHPALAGWDLGGGDLITHIPPRAPEAALGWLEQLTTAAQEADPQHPCWYGGDSGLLLAPTAPRVHEISQIIDRLALSVVPFISQTARGPADHEFILYTLQLTGTLAETGGRPLGCLGTGVPAAAPGLVEEVIEVKSDDPKAPPRRFHLPSEKVQADFMYELIPAAQTAGVPFLFNMTYANAPVDLWGVPPLDEAVPLRRLGLVRADGREKPAAAAWRDLAGRLAHDELGAFGRDARTLDIDTDEFYAAPAATFQRWYRRMREGEI